MSRTANECASEPLFPSSPGDKCQTASQAGDSPSSMEDPFVRQIVGEELTQVVEAALQHIEVAFAMVEEASTQNPQFERRYEESFELFRWCLPVRVTELGYRAHVRELLERLAREESLRGGTKAEVLTLLCSLGPDQPLDAATRVLLERLFEEVTQCPFPETKLEVTEALDHESSERYRELAQRMIQVWREHGLEGAWP